MNWVMSLHHAIDALLNSPLSSTLLDFYSRGCDPAILGDFATWRPPLPPRSRLAAKPTHALSPFLRPRNTNKDLWPPDAPARVPRPFRRTLRIYAVIAAACTPLPATPSPRACACTRLALLDRSRPLLERPVHNISLNVAAADAAAIVIHFARRDIRINIALRTASIGLCCCHIPPLLPLW
ncbi:hypothetical protein G3M48_002034 [Beauveria asiatica]|uniref:Uncharacterized protein n=1 Tax=Beauveria asiatica TaxID=1069075 RepID=A0AAW0RYU7_9HYPO